VSLPKAVPSVGSIARDAANADNSILREGYFLINRLASFLN